MSEPVSVDEQNQQELLTELEELTEPLPTPSGMEQLAVNTIITSPDGKSFHIAELVKSEPQLNFYTAIDGVQERVCLQEALSETSAAARLRHEAEVLEGLNCSMFPQLIDCFERDGKTFLVTEEVKADTTLADFIGDEERQLPQIISWLAQTAFALKQMHNHGWVHLGLRPTHIIIDKPIKILDFSYTTAMGEIPNTIFSHAGYSPPELAQGVPVSVEDDIYAVGAILFQAVTGQTIPEHGAELTFLPAVAGVKQILVRCLGIKESRYQTMAELHQDLLHLNYRLEKTVSYSLSAATTIGLETTRTTNQDAYGYLSGKVASEEGEQTWTVTCVADGMGGMAAGEIASEVAVKAILVEAATAFTQRRQISPEDQAQWVKDWVHEANRKVCAAMEARRVRGGCTLICACLVDRYLTIAHVGDSRLYQLHNNQLTLLTRDHSLAMAFVLQGQIQPEEIRNHSDRNKVTRSLGDRQPMPNYFIDTLEQTTGKTAMELQAGDVLLLCSDGLWEPVLEAQMHQVLCNQASDLNAATKALLKIALQQGAPDNATVLLLRLDEMTVPQEGNN